MATKSISKYPKAGNSFEKNQNKLDPVKISQKVNHHSHHFILYPSSAGYHFAYFYRFDKLDSFEIYAVSHKAYKLKSEAITAMKVITYALGGSAMNHPCAFDHKGEKISLDIPYDIKKLLS